MMIMNRKKFQYQKHLGKSRQYWRDIILGVNDGLVSTFLLVAGVAGGGLSSTEILLTAIAGAIAGAISMAAGEYVATKSQNEVMTGEISLEQYHVENNLDDEMEELNDLFDKIGLVKDNKDEKADPSHDNEDVEDGSPSHRVQENKQQIQSTQDRDQERDSEIDELKLNLKRFYSKNPKSLLTIMKSLEFGVVDDEIRSPFRAGSFSCVLFIFGSLPSVLPFFFSGDKPIMGLVAAACGTVFCLMLVGAVKTWATRGRMLVAAIENLVIAGVGGGMAYGIGVLFESLIR